MPGKPHNVSEVINDSAVVLAIVLAELGFSGMTTPILARGEELLEAATTADTADALGDDLDAYSVAVGFAAAMGAFASCLNKADSAIKLKTKASTHETLQQMRKAKDN